MLSSKYALIGGLLLGLAAYADEFPGYEPPFKASSSLRKTVTTCVPGKAVTCFQGSGMSLKFFLNGTPNWFSPDQKMRYGAITADFNGKTLNGVRSAGENQKVIQYTYPELPGLKFDFSLRDDGLVNASLGREEGLTGCELKMIFIGEFFGGSVIKIDNKSFAQPPYRADASFYKKLFDGSASELTFFAERPDKTVTVKFAAPVKLTLASTGGRYTVWIGVKPAAGAKSIDFVINPGSVEVAADNTPVGVTTKVGRYDFWKEDRLRLPYRGDKNLLSNNSFEQGWSYLWQTHIGGGVYSQPLWDTKPLAIDDKEAFDGSHSLRILSDRRRAGLNTHIAVHPVILTPGTYTVSLYAKTDKPGKQQLMLDNLMMPPGSSIFDAKIHDVKKIDLSGEWTRYSHTFKIEVTQPHYFSFSASSNEPANCHIDAIQLEAGDHATDYEPTPVVGKLTTSAEDNLLATGAQADAKLEITTGQPQVRGEVETIVRDFFGRKIRSQKNSFTTDDKGRAAVALDFEKMPRGIFTIENRYQLNNGKGRYEFFRFAVMDFLDNTHKHKNLFANAYIDMFSTSQNYREVLERYRRIGIGSRGAYADTEELVAKESAKYGIESFSTMLLRGDRNLVKGMEKPSFGFTVLNNIVWYACLADDFQRQDYATITLPFSDPAKLKAIEDAAARRAKEAPWVKAWGAINEAEGSIPEFANSRFATEERYRQYVELELAVARGIKRGNPNTMVGNSSTSCLRSDRFETIDKLLTCIGDRFRYDCFIFHIYRAAPEYPDLDSDYQSVFKVLAKHGYKDTPIFSPEGMHWKPYRMPGLFEVDWIGVPWGPLSYDMGHEERLTAAWRARTWLVGLKNADRVKQMNSSTNFWSFEMDFALTPFANQKISNTLGRLLGNADFVKEVRFSGKTRCYLFVDAEKRPVVALWSCDPDVDRGIKAGPTLRFEKPYPQMSLFDLMEVEWSFGGETKLTPFPVFLRGEPGSLAAVESALGNAELSGDGTPAANASFELKAPADYRLTLNNSGKHAFRGKVNMGGIATQVELRPGETKSIPGKLPAELTDTRVNFESIGAEVTQTMPRPGHYLLKEEFAGVMSNRADIKVDGDISDWAQIPELPIDQRRYTVSGDNLKRHQQTGAIAATLKLAWNNGTLYMLIDVTDPVHKLNPRTRLVDGWRSDSVQVFFDSFADGRRADAPGLGVDDWEYGVYVDPVSVKPYVYRHHVPDAQLTLGVFAPKAETVSDDVECAFVKTDKGYRYELGFKERALMPFKAGAGKMLGVGVLLNNQNTDAPMPQERLFWGIAPELPNARPDLWPVVVLKK